MTDDVATRISYWQAVTAVALWPIAAVIRRARVLLVIYHGDAVLARDGRLPGCLWPELHDDDRWDVASDGDDLVSVYAPRITMSLSPRGERVLFCCASERVVVADMAWVACADLRAHATVVTMVDAWLNEHGG